MAKLPKPPHPFTNPKGFTKTSINFPNPIHRALKKRAKEENRSVSGQAIATIKAGLEIEKTKP